MYGGGGSGAGVAEVVAGDEEEGAVLLVELLADEMTGAAVDDVLSVHVVSVLVVEAGIELVDDATDVVVESVQVSVLVDGASGTKSLPPQIVLLNTTGIVRFLR